MYNTQRETFQQKNFSSPVIKIGKSILNSFLTKNVRIELVTP